MSFLGTVRLYFSFYFIFLQGIAFVDKSKSSEELDKVRLKMLRQIDIVRIAVAAGKKDMAMTVLLKAKECYDKHLQAGTNRTQKLTQRVHLLLIQMYQEVYDMNRNHGKAARNCLLYMKYSFSYGSYELNRWMDLALAVVKECMRIGAFLQSFYVLEACTTLLNRGKDNAHYKGLVSLMFATHCLFLFKNAICDTSSAGKKHRKSLDEMIIFYDLPEGVDAKFTRPFQNDDEVLLVYGCMMAAFADAEKKLGPKEAKKQGYNALMESADQLKQFYEFLGEEKAFYSHYWN